MFRHCTHPLACTRMPMCMHVPCAGLFVIGSAKDYCRFGACGVMHCHPQITHLSSPPLHFISNQFVGYPSLPNTSARTRARAAPHTSGRWPVHFSATVALCRNSTRCPPTVRPNLPPKLPFSTCTLSTHAPPKPGERHDPPHSTRAELLHGMVVQLNIFLAGNFSIMSSRKTSLTRSSPLHPFFPSPGMPLPPSSCTLAAECPTNNLFSPRLLQASPL